MIVSVLQKPAQNTTSGDITVINPINKETEISKEELVEKLIPLVPQRIVASETT